MNISIFRFNVKRNLNIFYVNGSESFNFKIKIEDTSSKDKTLNYIINNNKCNQLYKIKLNIEKILKSKNNYFIKKENYYNY